MSDTNALTSDPNAPGFVYVANSGSQSISVFELDAVGGLRARDSVAIQAPVAMGRSIVLALSPSQAFLYASYVNAAAQAAVATLSIDPNCGTPRLLASTPIADSDRRSQQAALGVVGVAIDRTVEFVDHVEESRIRGKTHEAGTRARAHADGRRIIGRQ